MNEILIVSGKGGTGKTTFTAAFSFFLEKNDIILDCDVDAADMHILLEPNVIEEFDFYSGKYCKVIKDKCIGCGICEENCYYNAIKIIEGKAHIDHYDCEHCLLCYRICSENAIKIEDALQGKYFVSKARTGNIFVHARLIPGADNSGKLVSTIRTLAKKYGQNNKSKFILIDGPPGIGCPVIASISGVKAVVFIAEPSKSGLHDLMRVVELTKYFNVKLFAIINKFNINDKITDAIKEFCIEKDITLLGKVPYSKKFYRALTEKKSIVEIDKDFNKLFRNFWEKIRQEV